MNIPSVGEDLAAFFSIGAAMRAPAPSAFHRSLPEPAAQPWKSTLRAGAVSPSKQPEVRYR